MPGPGEINPALEKQKCGYFYGTHIFFNADIFMEQIFVQKYIRIYMYIYRLDAGSDSETSLREI